MHKWNGAFVLLHSPVMCGSLLSATLSQVGTERGKRGKQAETEWKKGCRQHLYSAVLWPPKRPWKVWGGTKLQPLWCLWIRGVDRRESGQQGCSTESGWRYAGAFRASERKVEGKDFLSHKSWGTVLPWGEALSRWGVILGVPQGSALAALHYRLTKDPEFPLDNKIFWHPWIREVAYTREMQVHVLL